MRVPEGEFESPQMSFGFSGGFWPMGLPLFHASRFFKTAMIDSLVINRSLIFRFGEKRLLSEIMLYACCRPIAEVPCYV